MAKDALFETAVKENLIKNVIIVVLAFLFYGSILSALRFLDTSVIGNFLLIISILLVTVCFACFSFTYQSSAMDKLGMRLLSHATTFLFMLLLALLLETMTIAVGLVYPSLYPIIMIFSIVLYIGVALYDFWDFFRWFQKG